MVAGYAIVLIQHLMQINIDHEWECNNFDVGECWMHEGDKIHHLKTFVICTDVFWYPFSFIKYQTEFADVHSRFEVHAYSYCEASSGDCIW